MVPRAETQRSAGWEKTTRTVSDTGGDKSEKSPYAVLMCRILFLSSNVTNSVIDRVKEILLNSQSFNWIFSEKLLSLNIFIS